MAGDHRQAHTGPVPPDDQGLEDLPGRHPQLQGDRLGGQVVGVDLVVRAARRGCPAGPGSGRRWSSRCRQGSVVPLMAFEDDGPADPRPTGRSPIKVRDRPIFGKISPIRMLGRAARIAILSLGGSADARRPPSSVRSPVEALRAIDFMDSPIEEHSSDQDRAWLLRRDEWLLDRYLVVVRSRSSWPLATLLIALIFRQDVGKALGRVGQFKYRDLELTFRDDLRQAEQLARAIPPPASKGSVVLEVAPDEAKELSRSPDRVPVPLHRGEIRRPGRAGRPAPSGGHRGVVDRPGPLLDPGHDGGGRPSGLGPDQPRRRRAVPRRSGPPGRLRGRPDRPLGGPSATAPTASTSPRPRTRMPDDSSTWPSGSSRGSRSWADPRPATRRRRGRVAASHSSRCETRSAPVDWGRAPGRPKPARRTPSLHPPRRGQDRERPP